MKELKNFQKKYLKGLAHNLKPVVFIGQKGITESLLGSINEAFEKHELIKLKFIDFKEKEFKEKLTSEIVDNTNSFFIGMIGHTIILYRESSIKKNRRIHIPESWENKD